MQCNGMTVTAPSDITSAASAPPTLMKHRQRAAAWVSSVARSISRFMGRAGVSKTEKRVFWPMMLYRSPAPELRRGEMLGYDCYITMVIANHWPVNEMFQHPDCVSTVVNLRSALWAPYSVSLCYDVTAAQGAIQHCSRLYATLRLSLSVLQRYQPARAVRPCGHSDGRHLAAAR